MDHGIIDERDGNAIIRISNAPPMPAEIVHSPTNFPFELSAIITFKLRSSTFVPSMQFSAGPPGPSRKMHDLPQGSFPPCPGIF